MWTETALLYAWIRVCLQGAGSRPRLCPEQRNCAGRGKPQASMERAPETSQAVPFHWRCPAPPREAGEAEEAERKGGRP